MYVDSNRFRVWSEIRQQGIGCFASKLSPEVLAEATNRCGKRTSTSPLCLPNMAWLAVASALKVEDDFSHVLMGTFKLLKASGALPCSQSSTKAKAQKGGARKKSSGRKCKQSARGTKKHSPHRTGSEAVSEEAFAQARGRVPLSFWAYLLMILGENFQRQHGSHLRLYGFRLLAIDGTSLRLPNRKALRESFGTSKNKQGEQNAQARMVMLQFPLVRLPYRYELCGYREGEPTIARRLAVHLCPNDLMLADAGFWSYGLFCDIQNQGAFFCIALKRNIQLTNIVRLGRDDIVGVWRPKDSRSKWRNEKLPQSMKLRIVTQRRRGFRPQRLATNVLSASRVSHQQWTRLAEQCGCDAAGRITPSLYQRRWEIETTFRELKVEQGMERGLRSRTANSIHFEVAGHVLLYFLVRWTMVEAGLKHRIDPLRLSFRNAHRELINLYPMLLIAAPEKVDALLDYLLDEIAQHRVPYRPGRSYPRRKRSTNHKRTTRKTKARATRKQKKQRTRRNAA